MEILEILGNFLLGGLLGLVGGIFGIGGGLIAIPALGIFFGLDQQLAQGTALVMVVPNVLVSCWRYYQRNKIDWRHALLLAGFSFALAWVGAKIAVGLDNQQMRLIFVIFLVILSIWTFIQLRFSRTEGQDHVTQPWPYLAGLGSFSGFVGGLFGVGGAVVATPILTLFFGLTQVLAQGLSLSLAIPSTSVTLFTYAMHDQINWSMGIPLALGGILTVSYGVKIAHAMPQRLLRKLFACFLLVSAGLLFNS